LETTLLNRPVRLGLLGLALASFVLIPFALWGEAIDSWTLRQAQADVGTILEALLGGGLLAVDVLLPVPSSIVGVFLGAALGTVNGALVGAVGLTIGCMLGYGLGRLAGPWLTGRLMTAEELAKGRAWLERHGVLVLALLRPVPVLAEASVIASGAMGISLSRVLVVTALANLGVSAVYASLGAAAPGAVILLCAVAAAVSLPAVALAGINLLRPHGTRWGRSDEPR
jgi:uncharacterized membrane protein YdjX (TVP38/TMEM64 family)